MKKLLAFTSIFILLATIAGCKQTVVGNGNKQTETRNVDAFETIRMVGNFQLNINIRPTQQIVVTADSNLIPLIQTEVHNKTLIVQAKGHYDLQSAQTPQLDITVNRLADIGIIGRGSVNASGINSDTFEIKLLGSGNINVAGKSQKIDIKVVGSGQVVANNLIAEEAEVQVAGTSNVSVYASKKLNVRVSGAGKVNVYGEPREVEQKISGSGEVIIGTPNAQKNSTQNP